MYAVYPKYTLNTHNMDNTYRAAFDYLKHLEDITHSVVYTHCTRFTTSLTHITTLFVKWFLLE